jgi:hypothetical protein
VAGVQAERVQGRGGHGTTRGTRLGVAVFRDLHPSIIGKFVSVLFEQPDSRRKPPPRTGVGGPRSPERASPSTDTPRAPEAGCAIGTWNWDTKMWAVSLRRNVLPCEVRVSTADYPVWYWTRELGATLELQMGPELSRVPFLLHNRASNATCDYSY